MTRRSLKHLHECADRPGFYCLSCQFPGRERFYNLLDVYLDAVFHPLIKHLSFLQEAHRLSFTTAGDVKALSKDRGLFITR